MDRDPSIHITESQLISIIKSAQDLGKFEDTPKRIAKFILQKAKGKSITHRTINATSAKGKKLSNTVSSSTIEDTQLFIKLLILIRRKRKHRGVSNYAEGSRDWLTIKSIIPNVVSFCKEFELPRESGFKQYIEIAMDKMQRFYPTKLRSLHEGICFTKQSLDEIHQDPYKHLTQKAYDEYEKSVAEKTGIGINYISDPDKYCYFVRVAKKCHEYSLEPRIYIQAQFEGLSYMDGYPDPAQLVGDKAEKRLIKHAYVLGIKLKATKGSGNTPIKVNFKAIKGA